jgi:formylglycine-generating enzyme required for sulfatase activity
MAYVDAMYCPKVRQTCKKDEFAKDNKITICHEFAPGQVCLGKERRQRFCIDKYEYPNKEGAHPPVMVDWYDAMGACAQRGKRLCWESEWVAACEGPEKLPFPYGLKRDSSKCNIDSPWIDPSLTKVYSSRKEIQDAELMRIDRSVPSGGKPGCVSGFGVHDLTGNFDEWAISEDESGDSKWAVLKGGAWGHVRNSCRPRTTKHPPEFTYYFVSFRCCADAKIDGGDADSWKPPAVPNHPDPSGKVGPGWTPPAR